VERVKTWLIVYAGAEDSDYTKTIGEKFMIGALARATRPGCKLDTMLALRAGQGTKKSSVFEVIGKPFYKSNLNVADLHGKEARQEIRGSWMVEVPELHTISKSHINATKAFLSESVDSYRPSYGRHKIDVPRRQVFCGTMNKGNPFLHDTERQRRLWVAPVTKADLDAIERDRAQLLAEAKVLLDKGVPWWVDDISDEAFAVAMEKQQAPCRSEDPWTGLIEDWLAKCPKETTVARILEGIGIPTSMMDRRAEMRAAAVLSDLGWDRARRRVDGERAWWWAKAE
jgi:predicted P-loop ATPase